MSKMTPPQDVLEELFNGLLDTTLTVADETQLAGMLAESAEARGRYRKWMELHAALHWDYAGAATHVPDSNIRDESSLLHPGEPDGRGDADHRTSRLARSSILVGASMAAATLLVLICGWLAVLQRSGERPQQQSAGGGPLTGGQIVEVVSLGGAASWSDCGKAVFDLAVGNRLRAGTASLEGESSFLTLRFDDGTKVTLAGESVLEFDARWQKTLILRHGALSVDATPQPLGRPMLVRTPTAEVEVLGTVFSVSSDSQVTHVGVKEGSVRFLRLADRQSVEVHEHTVATASLVATEPLEAGRLASIPPRYRKAFGGERGMPVGLRALPYVAGRSADGRPVVHFGVNTRKDNFGFVTMHDDSVVSVRFRTSTPEPIRVMIGMRRQGGGFGGNFEVVMPSTDSVRDDREGSQFEDGWRRLEIPARAFKAISPDFPDVLEGYAIGLLLVDTFTSDAQLEVAEVFVSRRADEDESR